MAVTITNKEKIGGNLVRIHATDETGRRAVLILNRNETTDDNLAAIFGHKFDSMGPEEGKP